MKFTDLILTAVNNLTRRKVRTTLTALGVTVGIFTIVVMVSLGVGVQTEINSQFEAIGLENVVVQPRSETRGEFDRFLRPQRQNPITPEKIEEWRQLPNVVEVRAAVDVNSAINKRLRITGDDSRSIQVFIDPGFGITNPLEEPAAALAGILEPANDGEIVISREAADDLGLTGAPETLLGQQLQIVLESPRGESEVFDYTLVGINNQEEEIISLTPEDSFALKAWWFNDPTLLEKEGYDFALIRASDINAARQLSEQFRSQNFRVQSIETVLELASRIFLVINIMLGSIGALALFVASIGIMNTMVMAIYERTREIGTLKAIGASRSNVRSIFMLEAGMIGFLGGLMGLLGGWLAGIGLDQIAVEYLKREEVPLDGPFFLIPPWLIALALGFAVFVGVAAGLYPAARAARLDPIKALRHE